MLKISYASTIIYGCSGYFRAPAPARCRRACGPLTSHVQRGWTRPLPLQPDGIISLL